MREIFLATLLLRVFWTDCDVSFMGSVASGSEIHTGIVIGGGNHNNLYAREADGRIKMVFIGCIYNSAWVDKP